MISVHMYSNTCDVTGLHGTKKVLYLNIQYIYNIIVLIVLTR